MPPLTPHTISLSSFNEILSRYPSTVPDRLTELDTLRYNTIPTTLARRVSAGNAHLTKPEVEKLVEWKLKHGTFRPKLLQLVQSNPAPFVENVTRDGFKILEAKGSLSALKKLTELKGVGPATAALLGSVYAPDTAPFFSDELYRWCMWDEGGGGGGGGKSGTGCGGDGWKRVIKYSVKEYEGLVREVEKARGRLGVGAMDCERVAWVLGREEVDVGRGDEEGGGGEKEEEKVEVDKEIEARKEEKDAATKGKVAKEKKGVKRKAGDRKEPVEGIRRSSRRKTTA